jgi:hypothetical protein
MRTPFEFLLGYFINTHCAWAGGTFFQLCCCVSVFWFWWKIGFGVTYVLRVQYSCGVVLVFVPGGKSFLILRTYLVYNTVVWLCQFFGCGGKEFLFDLRKILIGFLYFTETT